MAVVSKPVSKIKRGPTVRLAELRSMDRYGSTVRACLKTGRTGGRHANPPAERRTRQGCKAGHETRCTGYGLVIFCAGEIV